MEQTAHHSPNGAGHEQSEVSVRLIVVSLAFLAVGTFLVFVLVVGIFRYFYDTDKTAEALRQGVIPPEPRIEVAPYEQLQQLRAHEDHVLNSYAWVDKSTGTVRVPIDRAIDMLAAKGLPSHNYLDDILAGKKAPAAGRPPTAAAKQGSSDAK
jgi:hypothetical protein